MTKQRINEKDRALLSGYGLQNLDLSRAERRVYGQGEFISLAGEPINDLYFVVSGKAKVLISLLNGKQLLLAYFTSRGILGDMELATNEPANYITVRAVTELSCITLPLNVYAAELKANNVFINYVAKELAEKLTQRAVNGAITTLQPLEARLCAYIAQAADDGYFRETLTEVAEVVGASYRHLLRCLVQLCGKKILTKEASGYRVTDRQLLDNIAGDLYA